VPASDLKGRGIAVVVTGGIAAYKVCDLVSTLTKAGADVRVVMTENARRFVGEMTFATLSGNPVSQDLWAPRDDVHHIGLAEFADVAIIAPATANIIGKFAHGIADDLASTALLAFDCPTVVAPAMNSRMLRSDPVQANLATLRERGVHVLEPEEGWLACGETGAGRLPGTDTLVEVLCEAVKARGGPLQGVRVLVTAGPTREAIDPVRFISNPSSGRMGHALAAEAERRGAEVTLVSGPTALEPPPGVDAVDVTTAERMHQAVQERTGEIDLFIGAAAVADWRPAEPEEQKLHKDGRDEMTLRMVRTPDIIAAVATWEPKPFIVGFAAETEDTVARAAGKLRRKGMDMIVANDVTAPGAGFDVQTNRVTLIDVIGRETDLPLMSKRDVAAAILDRAGQLMASRESQ
jgi:phosphopantothenoylcysteine decarboxylase/phosphopantothenate--cysteine ligase